MAGAIAQDRQRCQFPFLVDENPLLCGAVAWRYDLGFLTDRAITAQDVHRREQIRPDFRRIRNQRNHYLQDRQLQKTTDYTGIEDFLNEDACATESMGPIFDRTREHLGISDKLPWVSI